MKKFHKYKAFTLIELSISLVIVGLIIGGILAGRELIKSSEIRSLMNDVSLYQTAFNTFKLKYDCMPGDCRKASTFLNTSNNGNGNYLIGNGNNGSNEEFYVWQHLALANMILGSYTGAASSPNRYSFGVNIPGSKIPNVGYGFDQYLGMYGNANMMYGLAIASNLNITNISFNGAAIPPEYAQQIDTKSDDGVPNKGKILVMRGANVASNTVCVDQPITYNGAGPAVNYLSSTDSTNSCRVWYLYY